MKMSWLYAVAVVALCAVPVAARADQWDLQDDNDDTTGTDNELVHGTSQQHDLGVRPGPVADEDWFLMPQKRQASYEVIVDGVSGDLGFSGFALERVQVAGVTTTSLQTGAAAVEGSNGYTRALRWSNTTSTTVTDQLIKVSGGFCGTTCNANDGYSIHVRETTVNLARFNAAGTQATILLTQNTTERTVNATFFYWNAAGTLLQTGTLSLASKGLNVFNVATFPALAGQSGHITVVHDGGYGGLNIKSVALEPSTGFSFDTPGVYVPN
jgi:hypothetical protein